MDTCPGIINMYILSGFLVSILLSYQCAKKGVSICPGLVDFSVRLVDSLLHFPNGEEKVLGKIQIKKVLQKMEFGGLVRMTFRLAIFVIVLHS